MTRVISAQLNRFVRRRTIHRRVVGAIAFALVATLSVFSSPLVAGAAARRGGATLAALTGAGGGTEAFAVAASFAGFLSSSPLSRSSGPSSRAARSARCCSASRTAFV